MFISSYFMIQINFYKSKNVLIVMLFKILNNLYIIRFGI